MELTIHCKVIPHESQRYDTAGDWFVGEDGVLEIRASEMSQPHYSALVILHELVEVLVESIKRTNSIAVPNYLVKLTDKFDEMVVNRHLTGAEPGYDNQCPVYQGHMVASAVEHMAAMLLSVDYNEYQAEIMALEW